MEGVQIYDGISDRGWDVRMKNGTADATPGKRVFSGQSPRCPSPAWWSGEVDIRTPHAPGVVTARSGREVKTKVCFFTAFSIRELVTNLLRVENGVVARGRVEMEW